jgi:hypothetical protein
VPRAAALAVAFDRLEEPTRVVDEPLVGEVALADRATQPVRDTLDAERVALLPGDGLVGVLEQAVQAPGPSLIAAAVVAFVAFCRGDLAAEETFCSAAERMTDAERIEMNRRIEALP